MTYIVQTFFKTKSGEVRKGQVITMPEDKAQPLLRAGTITELKACHICGEYAWWVSIRGAFVCGVCHPPTPGAVKKWIGEPEMLNRLKVSRSAVILSWQEIRAGEAASDRQR